MLVDRTITGSAEGSRRLATLRAVHTGIWFLVEANFVYLLYTGLTRRAGRATDVAAAIVTAETSIFVLSGFRCPLTGLARSLGAEQASVTDLYLPKWLAHALPVIHTPLLALVAYLYFRNRRGTL
jgi:hypothetical protein